MHQVRVGGRSIAQGLSKEQIDELLGAMEELSISGPISGSLIGEPASPIVSAGELDASLYIVRSGEAHAHAHAHVTRT